MSPPPSQCGAKGKEKGSFGVADAGGHRRTFMLKVTGVEKHFGGVRAIQGCTLEVRRGSITGLIGPNGAGKTTLFNVISGMLKPDRGEILFEGKRIDGVEPYRIARMGLLRTFQLSRGLKRMTVLENLMLYPQAQTGERLSRIWFEWGRIREQEEALREKALQILRFVNLFPLRDAYAEELSGGQKKLLELARVLMAEPRIVLLDEPGAGVNPALMKELIDRILALRDQGITFLLIEHDMDLVLSLCRPVIVMTQGKKLAEGSFEEIRQDPRVLEAYLGRKH
jgi:branched-chain amino acid transport system ATP-binding protein